MGKQAGANCLLLPKRLFRLVRTRLAGQPMVRRLYTSLQTARTFVKKHEILSFMLVTARLLTLTLVVPDAESVVDVELRGDAEHIRRPLRRSLTVSTSTTSLFPRTGGLGH